MNAFNWQAAPRATKNERKATNKRVDLSKGRDFLGVRAYEPQPGVISIDPHPDASRAKQAKLTKVAI